MGGRTARVFLDAGWQVTGVYRKRNPFERSPHPALSVIRTDLRNCQQLPGSYDCLVHCAADVPAYCANEDELYRSNVEGTQHLLALASTTRVGRIIYLSSMAVYGSITVPLVNEDTLPNSPDIYGRSKAEGERLVAEWAYRTGYPAASIRLPGVIGPGGRNNFLCDALQRIISGQVVRARNPEALFNNLVHINTLAAFVVSLVTNNALKEYATLTVAATEPLTIRDVLARMYRGVGRKEQIAWEDGGAASFLIAFDRACSLGYVPETVADSIDQFVSELLTEPY